MDTVPTLAIVIPKLAPLMPAGTVAVYVAWVHPADAGRGWVWVQYPQTPVVALEKGGSD